MSGMLQKTVDPEKTGPQDRRRDQGTESGKPRKKAIKVTVFKQRAKL
jgi:hypothetical protein